MFGHENITITKLILQETGTYNSLYSRPYETEMNKATLDDIVGRVENSPIQSGGGEGVTSALLSGIASNMIHPSATPQGEIYIPNGWGERRVRFVLEVLVTSSTGSTYSYFFQGYTTHSGITQSGNIDPQMKFIINSIVRVNRIQKQTMYGVQNIDTVTESSQIINGKLVSNQNDNMFVMRPQDVFLGIHSGHLKTAYDLASPIGDVYDCRRPGNSDSVRASRRDNIPANYLARVVDSYQTGSALLDFGQGSAELLLRSQDYCSEPSPNENIVIRAISNIIGIPNTTIFSYEDLRLLDPNIDNVTNYIVPNNLQMNGVHHAGQSAYWNSVDRETLMATVLGNAVPSLMMDLLIMNLSFRSTNHDMTGTMNTVIEGANSFTNTDISNNLLMFKKRLEKEILYDITYGNQELYTLSMRCNLLGETYIDISIGNGPMVSYVTPSFCDGLLTPMVTTDINRYNDIINDVEVLMNNIGRVENNFLSVNMNI